MNVVSIDITIDEETGSTSPVTSPVTSKKASSEPQLEPVPSFSEMALLTVWLGFLAFMATGVALAGAIVEVVYHRTLWAIVGRYKPPRVVHVNQVVDNANTPESALAAAKLQARMRGNASRKRLFGAGSSNASLDMSTTSSTFSISKKSELERKMLQRDGPMRSSFGRRGYLVTVEERIGPATDLNWNPEFRNLIIAFIEQMNLPEVMKFLGLILVKFLLTNRQVCVASNRLPPLKRV